MLRDPKFFEKYQLLCANCNWIKRQENNEACPMGNGFSCQERRLVGDQWQVKVGELWVPFTPTKLRKTRIRKDTVMSQDLLNAVVNRQI
jgi:hypothetical protein